MTFQVYGYSWWKVSLVCSEDRDITTYMAQLYLNNGHQYLYSIDKFVLNGTVTHTQFSLNQLQLTQFMAVEVVYSQKYAFIWIYQTSQLSNDKAINTAPSPPRIWLRYVDDTFGIQQAEHSQQFLQHINSIDQHIQFTTEVPSSNWSIPFLDLTTHY